MGERLRTITPVAPYDIGIVREFLTIVDGEEPSPQRRTLLRGWMMEGSAPVVVRLEDVGTSTRPSLEVELLEGDPARWSEIEATLRRSLSLDVDTSELDLLAADDPPFRALLESTRGYHQACTPTPFEAAAWSILTQHTFESVARAARTRLFEALGRSVEADGRLVHCFPDPGTVLANARVIRNILPRRRHAEFLLAAAETFREELVEREVAWMDPADVRALLRAIPGIGPWSCAFISLRGYGFLDELPMIGPAFVRRASAVYGRPLSSRDIRAIAAQYDPIPGAWFHRIMAFAPTS